jgi:hypothetical protein
LPNICFYAIIKLISEKELKLMMTYTHTPYGDGIHDDFVALNAHQGSCGNITNFIKLINMQRAKPKKLRPLRFFIVRP